MPNPNDGTQLGTGEVISDEFIAPVDGSRRDPNLPPTGYKLPRSKIAIGPYGQDHGDATQDYPLQAESAAVRRMTEVAVLRDNDESRSQLLRYASERMTFSDQRGRHASTRGNR